MVFAIELNNIVRDINTQIVKYYKKDIDKTFDDSELKKKCNNFIPKIPFKTKKDRNKFMYEDYPYEIFGCARVMERNIVNSIIEFEDKLNDLDDGNTYEVIHFSLKEIALTIQSSFYFLSKIGSRVRKVLFPKNGKDIWNECDVAITTNESIVKSKPKGKVVILIRTIDNTNAEEKADLVYDKLSDLLNDDDFISKIKMIMSTDNKISFVGKVKNNILNLFR